jgi:probable selenium-dependent hydroxylase accessory protein YqeC
MVVHLAISNDRQHLPYDSYAASLATLSNPWICIWLSRTIDSYAASLATLSNPWMCIWLSRTIDSICPKVLFSFGENENNVQTIIYQNEDSLIRAFDPLGGVTAIVGGGGKTTLMLRLARALAENGARVIVTTTTHIFPPEGIPTLLDATVETVQSTLMRENLICLGSPEKDGKLSAPDLAVAEMERLSDYVLIEADGAKRLPLKAPAEHEPVIPPETKLVIAVAGLDGIGKPIQETAFRPARYAALCGKLESDIVTAQDVALVLAHPFGQRKGVSDNMRFAVLLNKADGEERMVAALETALSLQHYPVERVVIASLGGRHA